MVDIICVLCGNNQKTGVLYPATFRENYISENIFSARRLPDRIHYRILKCERCGLLFSSPIFPADKLSKFYGKSSCSYEDQIPYLIKTYFKIVEQVKKNLPGNPKVLEVGCGNGFFLKALMDLGLTKKIFGIEPSKAMVAQSDTAVRSKIKISIFKPNLFPKNAFDLILCFHTLDHMVNPDEFIKNANTMLKKNGYFIVVVHDAQGLSVKMFGERSPVFDIEHIYLFNKKTLRRIFSRNSFRVIKIFSLVNNYPLSYWTEMSGFPHIFKKYAKRFLGILRIGKIEISIPAGNIALIAKNA